MIEPHIEHWCDTISGSLDSGSSKSSKSSWDIVQPISSGTTSSLSSRIRFCLRPNLILILRLFLAGFFGGAFCLASLLGRRRFFGGGDLVGFFAGGAFFGGAFFFGGGGGAFFFGGGGGGVFFGGGGGAFLPFDGGGGGGGGGFFAIPNTPCKQLDPLKKSGE